jgi:LytR cell envelope-related transcriptional attenuator
VASSQVYAVGGAATAAQQVASALGLAASSVEPADMPVPVPSTAGATVVVVVGPDLTSHS